MINKFEGEYFFLSNFYPSPFTFKEGKNEFIAKTVEHYFQYAKTLSIEEGIEILNAKTPGKAKQLGRSCHLREDWEIIKDDVMLFALREKFSNPELRNKLLATGDEELVEGNWWRDTYWGICEGVGQNKLGKLLMRVREEIRNDT